MKSAELNVILLNLFIVLAAYLFLYPRLAGADGQKIARYDLLASGTALFIVGWVFWGSGRSFSLIFFSANWFWFTLITYALIEIPFMTWYFNKHDAWGSLVPDIETPTGASSRKRSDNVIVNHAQLEEYGGMELNVQVKFRFEQATIQQVVTQAFDLVHMNSEADHSAIQDPLDELKQRLSKTPEIERMLQGFNWFDDYVTGLEWMKTSPTAGTTMHFVTGSDGVVFAHEMDQLLTALGAKSIRIKVSGDVGEG